MSEQPQTRREAREQQRGRGLGAGLVLAVIAVLVLGAVVWFGKDLFGGSPTATPTATTSDTPSGSSQPSSSAPTTDTTTSTASSNEGTTTPSATATADPVAAQVAACRSAWPLQDRARTEAATVLGEWKAHLDIMNRLQAGKISLAKAKQLWPSTTAKADQHIASFHQADTAFTSSKPRCTDPGPAATSPDGKSLATCAASMKVIDGVLAKARTAIEPWETHLKDQSHFKAGGMTAIRAEALWRSLWQKGLKLNPPYFSAAQAAATAGCPLAG